MATSLFNRACKLIVFAAILSVFVSTSAFAATYYWGGNNSGCTNNEWSDTDCWSDSGGTKLNAKPTSNTDNIYFDSSDTSNCTIDEAVSSNLLRTYSGYSGTITVDNLSQNVIMSSAGSSMWLEGGTFNAGGGTVSLGGDLILDGGEFNKYGGTVIVLDDLYIADQFSFYSIQSGVNDTDVRGSLIVEAGAFAANNNSATVLLDGLQINGGSVNFGNADVTISGPVTLDDQNYTAASYLTMSSGEVEVWGDFTVTDDPSNNLTPSTGTTTFRGQASNLQLGGNTYGHFSLYNIVINKSLTSYALTATSDLDFNGTLTLTQGDLTMGQYDLDVAGAALLNDAGSDLTSGLGTDIFRSTLTLNGSDYNAGVGTCSVTGDITVGTSSIFTSASGTDTFSDSIINNGGTINLKGTVNITDDIDNNSGTWNNTGTVSVGDDIFMDGGSATQGGRVNVASVFNHNIGTYDSNGYILDIEGALYVNGGTFTPGTLNVPTMRITSGTFNSGAGIINIESTLLNIDGGVFNAPTNDLIVEGNITVDNGSFVGSSADVSADQVDIGTNGSFTAPSGELVMQDYLYIDSTGTFSHNNGQLTFRSSVASEVARIEDNRATGDNVFYDLEIDLDDANAEFNMLDDITLNGDLLLTDGNLDGTLIEKFTVNGVLSVFSTWGSTADQRGQIELAGTATGTSTIFTGAYLPELIVNNPNASVELVGENLTSNTAIFQDGMTIDQGTVYLYLPDASNFGYHTHLGGGPPNAVHATFEDRVQVRGGTLDMNSSNGANPRDGDITFESQFSQEDGVVEGVTTGSTQTHQSTATYSSGTFTADTGDYVYSTLNINTSPTGTDDAAVSFSSAGSLDIDGNLTIGDTGSTGSVTMPSGTANLAGDVDIEGGTTFNNNSGKIIFDEDGETLIDVESGTLNLYDAEINLNDDTDRINFQLNSVDVSNDLALTNGYIYNGTITANDTLTWGSAFDGGGSDPDKAGTLEIITTVNVSIPSGRPVPKLILDNTNKTLPTLTVSTSGPATLSIPEMSIVTGGSGGAVFNNTGNADINWGALTIETGSLYAGGGNMSHSSDITLNGGTYDAEAADVDLADGAGLIISGGTFDATAISDMDSLDTDPTAAFDFNSGSFLAPTTSAEISVAGGWDQEDAFTFTPNSATIEFNGSTQSTLDLGTSATQTFYNMTMNKSSYILIENDTIEVPNVLTLTNGELRGAATSTSRVVADGDLSWAAGFDGYTAGNPATLVIKTDTQDVVIPDGSTTVALELDNTDKSDLIVSTTGTQKVTVPQLKIVSTGNGGATFDNYSDGDGTGADVELEFTSTVTIDDGIFEDGTNATTFGHRFYLTGGDYTNAGGSATHNNSTAITSGTYTTNTADTTVNNELDINGGNLVAGDAGTLDINASLTGVALDLDSGTFTAPGSGNTFTVDGHWDQESAAVFNNNGGTVTFDGSTDSRTFNVATANPGTDDTFNNVTLNKDVVTAASGTVTLETDLYVDGYVSIRKGELAVSTSDIYLGGNWSTCPSSVNLECIGVSDGQAAFTAGATADVILGTGDHRIFGSPTFGSLTKTTNSTLFFEAGKTTTITGTWTATGTSGNLLAIESTGAASNTVAYVNPTGTVNVDYVSIEDVDNVRGTDIDLSSAAKGHTENTDLGNNNQGWIFDTPYTPPAVAIPEFSTWLMVLTMLIGSGMIVNKQKGIIKIS